MKQYIPQEFFTKLIDRNSFVIMRNTMPPRDPDEDEDEEKTMTTKRTTPPTNRRSCASRTMTRIACGCQSAYSISHELGCEKRSAAQKTLGRRTERRADRAPSRV